MKKVLITLLLFFCFNALFASHFMGGQITYSWVSGNNYNIKLTLYRDCGGITMGTTQGIVIRSASSQTTATLTRTSLRDVTLLCPNQASLCNGGGGSFGVEEHIYEATIAFPQNAGIYTISFVGNARNAAITTLVSPGSQSLFLSATLDPNLTSRNNSPDLLNMPIANFVPNQLATLSPNGFDADGDVLRYSLVSARDLSETDPVNYASGFSALNPLSSSTPITINPNNGTISFTPSISNQIAVIAIKVEEYRNGVKIGEIYRDMQIRIFNINNNYPVISPVNTVIVPVGQNFCTSINATDVNNDSIDLSVVGLMPNSSFTQTANNIGNASGNFCFTPTAADAGRTFSFTVNAIDNNCPVPLASSMTFNIIVPKPCASLGLTTSVTNASNCGNNDGSVILNTTSTNQPFSYYWSASNGFVASSQNINNLSSGTYCVIVVDGNNCVDNICVSIANSNDTIQKDTTQVTDCNKIKFRNIIYTSNTTIIDTFRNVNGCDSALRFYLLNVVKPVTNSITKVSCNGEKIKYNEKFYSFSTNFIDTIRTQKGCDSIYNFVTIIIKKVTPITRVINVVSCNGKLVFNGVNYITSTIIRDTIRTTEGCDSIYNQININISNIKPQYQNITITGCGSVTYENKVFTSNTLLKDTLKSVYGCDSVYLNITISITQPVTPSISILNRGNEVSCKGANISIRAYSTNSGNTPTYQWTVNGNIVQTSNSTYFISNTLNNGDTIRCTMISSLPCVTTQNAISNLIIIKLVTPVNKTININACNNVVYNNITYSSNITIFDTIRNYLGCDSVINTVNITIKKVNVEINSINLFGCTSVSFNGRTYTSSAIIKDTLKTTLGCDSIYNITTITIRNLTPVTNNQTITGCGKIVYKGRTYLSSTNILDTIRTTQNCDSLYNNIIIVITPIVTPTIVITPSQNPVCNYTNIVFTATITNGGNNPQYQWYKNGILIPGATSATYTNAGVPDTSIVYTCTLTSNAPCAEPITVVSNNLRLTFGGSAIASINITANQTNICSTATFVATSINGGTSPQYQWKKNGVNISGATGSTYSTSNIANNDVFTCTLISNSLCVNNNTANSNSIIITVNVNSTTYQYVNNSTLNPSIVAPNVMLINTSAPISTTLTGGSWGMLGSYGTIQNDIVTFININPGSNYVYYIIPNQNTKCTTIVSKSILVVPPAGEITGNKTICTINGTTTLTSFASYGSGNWTSSNPSVATVTSSSSNNGIRTAVITGLNAGTSIITYHMLVYPGYVFPVSTTVTVAPVTVAPISGSGYVCVGSSIFLSNATPNGVWSSVVGRATISNTIGNSTSVTGQSAGTAEIRYTVTDASNTCSSYASKQVSVFAQPAVPSIAYAPYTPNPQTGTGGGYCVNRTFDLIGTPTGGTWASNNTNILVINNLGTVNTIAAGLATVTYVVSNSRGCINSKTITGNVVACAAKGITKTEDKATIQLYPNPAHSLVQLKVNKLVGNGQIVMYDLLGKQVKQQVLSLGNNIIDISQISKGLYVVCIITDEGKRTEKLVIE